MAEPKNNGGGGGAATTAAADAFVEIEISSKRNQSAFFPPTQEMLRGAWDQSNLPKGSTSDRGLMNLPSTPGMRIALNITQRTAKIHDPLLLPQNQAMYEEFRAVHAQVFGPTRAVPAREHELRDGDAVATWLHWMKRLVDSKMAKLVAGHLKHTVKGRPRLSWGATTGYERQSEEERSRAGDTETVPSGTEATR